MDKNKIRIENKLQCPQGENLTKREKICLKRKWFQRLFNLPADKEKSPTVLSLGGILYVGGGADTDGQVACF